MKVKVFAAMNVAKLEAAVNAFIADTDVVDIKFSAGPNGVYAMVIYRE